MCDPLTIGAATTGGADLLQSLFAPSPTAGSNVNLTRGGANEFLADLLKGQGLGVTNPQDIMNYFNQASGFLQGQENRALGRAGQSAFAQASASGITNPYALTQHAKNNVSENYSNQFGNLALQRAMAMLNQKNKEAELRTNLIGMGGQVNPIDSKPNFDLTDWFSNRHNSPWGVGGHGYGR